MILQILISSLFNKCVLIFCNDPVDAQTVETKLKYSKTTNVIWLSIISNLLTLIIKFKNNTQDKVMVQIDKSK